MANKGQLDAKIDLSALDELYVVVARLQQISKGQADVIRAACQRMETEESLEGGDGDVIRENFRKISVGITNFEKSLQHILTVFNDTLGKGNQTLKAGRTSADLGDKTDRTVREQGVFKKE